MVVAAVEGIAMLVVTRYRVPAPDAASFRERAGQALAALAARPGWLRGHLGRAVDDPTLWMLASEWVNVGSYRRALSSYDVKVAAVPLLSAAIDEPTAFEVLSTGGGESGERSSAVAADADVVGLGEAAAPVVPTDLERGGEEAR